MAKPTKTTTVSTAASLGQLEKVLEEYLVKKAPALPTNLKELLVKFAPYLAIIGVVLSVPALFTALSAGAWLSRNYYWAMTGATLGWQYYLALALSAVTVALRGREGGGTAELGGEVCCAFTRGVPVSDGGDCLRRQCAHAAPHALRDALCADVVILCIPRSGSVWLELLLRETVIPPEIDPGQGLDAQVVPSGPAFEGENNLRLFNSLVYAAHEQIQICSPYFVPDETMRYAITSAAMRGVDVELFASEIGDQFWMPST